jgi:hypothetical protein
LCGRRVQINFNMRRTHIARRVEARHSKNILLRPKNILPLSLIAQIFC